MNTGILIIGVFIKYRYEYKGNSLNTHFYLPIITHIRNEAVKEQREHRFILHRGRV